MQEKAVSLVVCFFSPFTHTCPLFLQSLKDINNMIRQGEQRTKKRAIAIDGDAESPAKRLCQENDDVLLKRLQDVVSERANH